MNMESGRDDYSMGLFLYHIFLISCRLIHTIGLEKNSLNENRSVEEETRGTRSGVEEYFQMAFGSRMLINKTEKCEESNLRRSKQS